MHRKNLRNLSVRGIVKNNIYRTRHTRRTQRDQPMLRTCIDHRFVTHRVIGEPDTRRAKLAESCSAHAILFNKVDGTRTSEMISIKITRPRGRYDHSLSCGTHTSYVITDHRQILSVGTAQLRHALYLTHTRKSVRLRPLPLPRPSAVRSRTTKYQSL